MQPDNSQFSRENATPSKRHISISLLLGSTPGSAHFSPSISFDIDYLTIKTNIYLLGNHFLYSCSFCN